MPDNIQTDVSPDDGQERSKASIRPDGTIADQLPSNTRDPDRPPRRLSAGLAEMLIWLGISTTPLLYQLANLSMQGPGGIFYAFWNPFAILPGLFLTSFLIFFPIFAKQIFGDYPLAALAKLMHARPERTSRGIASDHPMTTGAAVILGDLVPATQTDRARVDPRRLRASFAAESSTVAEKIYRRAGFYLLGGAFIAFMGLGIFSLRSAYFHPSSADLWTRIFDLLPGVGVLFFIEFVALFLLASIQSRYG